MPFVGEFPDPDPLRGAIEAAHRADETARLEALLGDAAMDAAALQRVADTARGLVEEMRRRRTGFAGLDEFLANTGCPTPKAWCSCAWRRRCCASPTPKRQTA